MTTIQHLRKIISGGETDQVEFKIKVNHPEKIIREIVAFANARGGNLLIGVDDNKNIIGVKDPTEETEILNKYLNDLVRPVVKFQIELIPISKKRKVIYYKIRESHSKPHFVNSTHSGNTGIAYIRDQDKTIQASKELLSVIKKKKRFKKGFMLKYGAIEELMIKKIDEMGPMTISKIQEETGQKKHLISRSLINLVLANVLELHPKEGEDLYSIKPVE